ncbi:MAG: GldM family protein [Bacteroidales bacterium]
MKRILCVLLIVISFSAFGQSISIANSKNNILYCGIENPLDVVVENMKCASFFLTTDNGQIKGEKCSYIIIPEKYHQLTIYVKKIIKNDTILIGKKVFRVKKIPLPTAYIGSKNCESIQKNYLIASGGIVARFLNMDFDLSVKIDAFSVIIFRDKTPIYKNSVVGNKFSEELIAEFKKLQSNDELIFYNMTFTNQSLGFASERLEPMDLTIE